MTRQSKIDDLDARTPEEVDIGYQGTKITLPETPEKMKLRAAIKVLEQKVKDEETLMDVHEIIEAHPMDALVAVNKAMKEIYGWTSAKTQRIESFFGTREVRPDLITVKTGPKNADSVQVLSGQFVLPNVESPIHTSPHRHNGQACLVIHGEAKRRDFGVIRNLCIRVREILKTDSIFRGKAIRLYTERNGSLDVDRMPDFLETDNIKTEELVLNSNELSQVEATLWSPIMNTDLCVKHGIPLNRGILLEGTFGTGKTMTAHVTSKVCVDNNWTYIVLDDVRGLADALLFAQRYQPAVVFAEDIDRIADKRDQAGNDLLNTIDGILTKNSKVITVLTTNHIEKLETAMLRPGRLDAVISVKAPDEESVKRLISIYGRKLIKEGETFDKVAPIMAGNIPATIREVVERAKLAMIYRGDNEIIENDLIISAENMTAHLDLLKEKKPKPSDNEVLGAAFARIIEDRQHHVIFERLAEDMEEMVKKMKKR